MDKKVVIATHNGMFHSDDVFAVATLLIALDSAPVVVRIARTRDEEVIHKADFVLDVGGVYDADKNRFDHHQIGGAGKRENGVPYASFGLVWKKFGEQVSGDATIASKLDGGIVTAVDANDSGVDLVTRIFADSAPFSIQDVVHGFRPTWQEDVASVDDRFIEAVAFARKVLGREIAHAKAKTDADALVRKAYEEAPDKRLIVLDAFYPHEKILAEYPEPLFSVFPRIDGSWNLKAIREEGGSFKNRKDLPESWAGKRDAELAEITGVPDAIFCHNARFTAVAKSKQGALRLAELALKS